MNESVSSIVASATATGRCASLVGTEFQIGKTILAIENLWKRSMTFKREVLCYNNIMLKNRHPIVVKKLFDVRTAEKLLGFSKKKKINLNFFQRRLYATKVGLTSYYRFMVWISKMYMDGGGVGVVGSSLLLNRLDFYSFRKKTRMYIKY